MTQSQVGKVSSVRQLKATQLRFQYHCNSVLGKRKKKENCNFRRIDKWKRDQLSKRDRRARIKKAISLRRARRAPDNAAQKRKTKHVDKRTTNRQQTYIGFSADSNDDVALVVAQKRVGLIDQRFGQRLSVDRGPS